MYGAIVERVKIRLRQFHIEEIEGSSTRVFDNLEDNPIIEECIKTNVDYLCGKIGKDFNLFDEIEFYEKYGSALVEFTLYDMCKEGGEYQISHSENGVNRSFQTKDDVFNSFGLFSYVKFLS